MLEPRHFRFILLQMSVFNNGKGITEYATLGNTGLVASKVCLGTVTFGNGKGLKAITSVGQAGADEVVKTSIGGGINFSDTADNYAKGASEETLGQSLKLLNMARKDVLTATKVRNACLRAFGPSS